MSFPDVPDWQPVSEIFINNGFLVNGGGNASGGLDDTTGMPASGLILAAPGAGLAYSIYSMLFSTDPNAGTGNTLEVDAWVNYPSTFFQLWKWSWKAAAAPIYQAGYVGGMVLPVNQPLGYTVSAVLSQDFHLSFTYRIVKP